jgi:hypothetical protein
VPPREVLSAATRPAVPRGPLPPFELPARADGGGLHATDPHPIAIQRAIALSFGYERPGLLPVDTLDLDRSQARERGPLTALPPPAGLLKGNLFFDLFEAHLRLYRRRFLQLKAQFAGFFKLYEIISTSFQIFAKFQDF